MKAVVLPLVLRGLGFYKGPILSMGLCPVEIKVDPEVSYFRESIMAVKGASSVVLGVRREPTVFTLSGDVPDAHL